MKPAISFVRCGPGPTGSFSRLWLALPALALAATTSGCQHETSAATASTTNPPAGQVWLTPAEVTAQKIEVSAAGEQVVDTTLLTSGTITLDDMRSGHVFSPVTGKVVKIMAALGQQVKKGEPLATIESPDIGQAVSDVHKAEADLIAAEHDLQRKRDLLAQNAAAKADVEASEDTERKARAELERARQRQFLLRVGNVDAVSQTYTMPSPIDGEVLVRNLSIGLEVQGQYSGGAGNICTQNGATQSNTACGELFTIGELDKVWVMGDIYEVDIARVHVGTKCIASTVVYQNLSFTGTVDWLSGALDPNTRTAKVRCTFDNPEGKLRPMMYATVAISVDQRKALAIPRKAIVKVGDRSYPYKLVFIQTGDADGRVHFERVPIDVDENQQTDYVEVKHGVEPGQQVVVGGADFLLQKLM